MKKDVCILIVDDNAKNIQVLATILEKKEYSIAIAKNGKEAIKLLDKLSPILILLDIMMPVMDGYEACSIIRKRPDTVDTPIIFLTAKTESEDIVKGFELGAQDYITKPFQEVELLARIKTHIEIKNNRDAIRKISEDRKSLLHILCHDLLNPVGQVKMILDLDNDDPGTINSMKPLIEKAVDNGLEVIELTRKMMAINEEKYKPAMSSEGLLDMLHVSLGLVKFKLEKKNIKVEMNVSENTTVSVERTSFINTVVNNLLTNAVKFSFPDSKIEIKELIDEPENSSGQICISIKDYGIGMPSEFLVDIFDVTKKTSRPGTEKERGTGFGMPLVKQFINLYGGSLDVSSTEINETDESNEDHGTEIKIYLQKAK
ncbi:MAG: hybrid sensor histidine kinase/response regulator [Leptospirales bacterium]